MPTRTTRKAPAKAGKLPEYKVKWFRDTRFRKAVSHAIDRQAIVRTVYRNLAYPQYATESVGEGPVNTPVDPIPMDLTKAQALRVSMMAQDGLARAIFPSHTPGDGDTLFVLATGGLTEEPNVGRIGSLAAEAVSDAILRAVREATGLPGFPAVRDLKR